MDRARLVWPRITYPPERVLRVRHMGGNRTVWTRVDAGGGYWSAPGYPEGVGWTQVLAWGTVEEMFDDE